jgi:very-short-patch-repair endonuclease
MTKSQNIYDNLSDKEKEKILRTWYEQLNKSFADIADAWSTYPNKVRRDAKKFNIGIRNKSDAQKNALQTGKHKHPTKGTERSSDIKQKIGLGVLNAWESLDDQELESRKAKAKANWDKLDQNQKENMQQAAIVAIRESSKVGSKLEKFLLKKLLEAGYVVQFHKEQSLVTTKLQIDLFLPTISTAIEVDGPSHFEPVWGEQSLNRNIKYDKKKEGLITGKGWHLIRIKQTKDFSNARGTLIFTKLVDAVKSCEQSKTPLILTIED